MAFSINDFISNLSNDGLRTNLFEISVMTGPSGSPNKFKFRAKATSIPSSSVAVTNIYYYGRRLKFAGNRDFDDWTVSVLMDEEDYQAGNTRGFFETWMSRINQHEGNKRDGLLSPISYFGQATVQHMSKIGGVRGEYKMRYCFPISVGPIGLDWGDNDRIAEFQVTFAYQWWTSIAVNN